MNKFELKAADIPFPILRSDRNGRITYKNGAAREDLHLKLKRSVVRKNGRERAEYAACLDGGKCLLKSIAFGTKKKFFFALFSHNCCKWYAPSSLERTLLLLRNASIEGRAAKAFSEAEEMLLSGKELPYAFGISVSKPWIEGASDNLTFGSYFSVLTLVSNFLFGENRFSPNLSESELAVISPERAFTAAGMMIRLMTKDSEIKPAVYNENGRIFISDGRFTFDGGELSAKEYVRVVPPFVCSKLEALSAVSGAYTAELFS